MTATREAPPPLTPDISVEPVNRRPRRKLPFPLDLYQTAVGKKWVMAVTGIAIMGFVFAHMVGNAKMYLGAVEMDEYGEALRDLFVPIFPRTFVLWALLRIPLIGMFALHLHAAYSLTLMNRRARPTKYQSRRDYIAANWASRTMRWTGIIVILFLVWHLADLTWGVKPAATDAFHRGSPYENLVASFNRVPVAILYIVANLALAVHLFHGAWSIFQSLGINNPKYNGMRKGFAIGFATLVCGVNISFPVMVLAGVVS